MHDLLEHFFDLAANGAVAREVNQPGAVLAGLGERDARGLRNFGEKLVRHLQENARAVTGVGLAAGGAAVIEVGEHLERIGDDLMRFPALHIDDEADAAGIMLKRGIVEALLAGRTREGRGRLVRQSGGRGGVVGGIHG